MKKSLPIIAIASIFVNIALIYVFVVKGEVIETEDGRSEIQMTEENKDFVFEEMRTFLIGIQKINEGILKNNPNLIIEGGTTCGNSVVEKTPKGMMRSLPIGFKKLGLSTHDLFDEIAESAKNNFDKTKTQEQLNQLLLKCTACHSSFKIGLKENSNN